jgi:hypothetical protein
VGFASPRLCELRPAGKGMDGTERRRCEVERFCDNNALTNRGWIAVSRRVNWSFCYGRVATVERGFAIRRDFQLHPPISLLSDHNPVFCFEPDHNPVET